MSEIGTGGGWVRPGALVGMLALVAILALAAPAAACTQFRGQLLLNATSSTLTVTGFDVNMGGCGSSTMNGGDPCPMSVLFNSTYDVELIPNYGYLAYQTGGLHHECMSTSPHRTIGELTVQDGIGRATYGPPLMPGDANIDPGDTYALCLFDDYTVTGNEIRVTVI